jgi:hypothetical protein
VEVWDLGSCNIERERLVSICKLTLSETFFLVDVMHVQRIEYGEKEKVTKKGN